MTQLDSPAQWQTKPSDRFILKWIKINLSARITPHLTGYGQLRPWMITICSMIAGLAAGFLYSLGWGFAAGVTAAASQVLDGVDGQFARLTQCQSNEGAFLDSVLDRYSDGALVIGLGMFNVHCGILSTSAIVILAFWAIVGSGLISYTSARAEALGVHLGSPTLAGKGTRTTAIALSGILSPLSSVIPLAALTYLAIHTNLVVIFRLYGTYRDAQGNRRLQRSLPSD